MNTDIFERALFGASAWKLGGLPNFQAGRSRAGGIGPANARLRGALIEIKDDGGRIVHLKKTALKTASTSKYASCVDKVSTPFCAQVSISHSPIHRLALVRPANSVSLRE
jgi:hypothetical protein